MQRQDEEALIAILYQEINQIKAELASQKKSKVPFIILSTLSTGIMVPLILWGIEYFLTNQKWPLIIQITNSFSLNSLIYLLFSTICTYLLIWWIMHRVTHPFRCTCGYTTFFPEKLRRHLYNHTAQKKKVA